MNNIMKPSDYLIIEPAINLRATKTAQKMRIWKGIVLIGATTDKKCIKTEHVIKLSTLYKT